MLPTKSTGLSEISSLACRVSNHGSYQIALPYVTALPLEHLIHIVPTNSQHPMSSSPKVQRRAMCSYADFPHTQTLSTEPIFIFIQVPRSSRHSLHPYLQKSPHQLPYYQDRVEADAYRITPVVIHWRRS